MTIDLDVLGDPGSILLDRQAIQIFLASQPSGAINTNYSLIIIYPEEGATIYKTTVLAFTVTGFDPQLKIEIQCQQGLTREVVYDGTNILAPYLKSIVFPIEGGFEFQLRRSNGWATPPSLYVVLRGN